MDTATPMPGQDPAPNHHAHHPGFSGFAGAVAAVGFTVGRTVHAELALELTGLGPGDDVVDIGCGPGAAARRAVARGAASVTGVDPAAVMLRTARAIALVQPRRARRLRYRRGTAEALPLADASASVAWSLATVHHWQDIDAGLAEVHRVLRPAGRFLALERLTDPTAAGVAGHGWAEAQAERFAERCRAAGFGAEVGQHERGGRRALSVVARRL